MLKRFDIRNQRLKNFFLTTLFCLVIALTTLAIWGGTVSDHIAISFGYGYCAFFLSPAISFHWPELPKPVVKLLAFFGAMLFGTLNAYVWLHQKPEFNDYLSFVPVIVLGVVFTSVSFLYLYTYEQKALTQGALEASRYRQSKQEKALLLSQLKQLQSQMEPHFLFNTLANINALITVEPYKAQLMLEKLTELLRGTMRLRRSNIGDLREEIQLIDAYLGIQKIRLGDRLEYTLPELSEWGSLGMPPMLIQPLVENAVSHGIEPKAEGGTIRMSIEVTDNWFELSVEDNGMGLSETPKGNGIALQSVRDRLSGLFGHEGLLTVAQNCSGGVTATIRIRLHHLQRLQRSFYAYSHTR
ncbi:sensor histidine kinase [Vibrio cholerae]|uniref:sensor histidine kinase n=1 Tax=Vibrio paracholerae TaxID=650003 RepID=UPI000D3976DB|nr:MULTISPECIES: histidine kinase [Vibrio]MBN7277976.1 sensor histidine kinase [Vibrio paracholerae]MBN7283749.1 sensor histidine kinase [Vibrio paracholerae]PUA70089.1 sensor histidine kinase [Vibrio cholerae]